MEIRYFWRFLVSPSLFCYYRNIKKIVAVFDGVPCNILGNWTLTQLVNQSFLHGAFPSILKITKVIPIPDVIVKIQAAIVVLNECFKVPPLKHYFYLIYTNDIHMFPVSKNTICWRYLGGFGSCFSEVSIRQMYCIYNWLMPNQCPGFKLMYICILNTNTYLAPWINLKSRIFRYLPMKNIWIVVFIMNCSGLVLFLNYVTN